MQTTNRESQQPAPSIFETARSLKSIEKLEQLYVSGPGVVLSHLLIILGAVTALPLVLLSDFYGIEVLLPQQSTTVTYLSVIATAQASVLAIGVSVLLLGFELIANRYSTQLTSVILENPVFPTTLGLLIGSIALDLWLIFNIGGLYTPVSVFNIGPFISTAEGVLLYITAPMALLSTVTLYFTVRHGVRKGTPEGVVKSIRNQLYPESYISQAFKSVEDDTVLHPIADLYFVLFDSIEKSEPRISHMAFDVYSTKVLKLYKYAQQEDQLNLFPEESNEFGGPLFEPVLKSHLPRMVSADLRSQQELTEKISGFLEELSREIQQDAGDQLFVPIANSYIRIINQAPWSEESDDHISSFIENLGSLLQDSICQSHYSNANIISHRSMEILESDSLPHHKSSRQIVYGFLDEISESFVSFDETYSGSPLWILDTSHNDTELETMRELTKLYLKGVAFLVDSSPNSEQAQQVHSLWDTIFTVSRNTVTNQYLEVLCQGIIENILICKDKSTEFNNKAWTNLLARTMEHQGPEVVLDAFDEVLNRKFSTESPWGSEGFWDELDERTYSSGIIPSSHHPTSTYANGEAIEEIRNEVLDEYRRRNWENKFVQRFVQKNPAAVEPGLSIIRTDVKFGPVDYVCRDQQGRVVHLVICDKFREDLHSRLDLTGIQRTIIISALEPANLPELQDSLEYDDLEICLIDFVDRPEPSQTQLREFFRDNMEQGENSDTDIEARILAQSDITDYG